jgi:hypothetical protein
VFIAHDLKIAAHNAGNHSWVMGHNQFSHLTPAQFVARFRRRGAASRANRTASVERRALKKVYRDGRLWLADPPPLARTPCC